MSIITLSGILLIILIIAFIFIGMKFKKVTTSSEDFLLAGRGAPFWLTAAPAVGGGGGGVPFPSFIFLIRKRALLAHRGGCCGRRRGRRQRFGLDGLRLRRRSDLYLACHLSYFGSRFLLYAVRPPSE